MMPRARPSEALPLLVWTEQMEMLRMQAERNELIRRIHLMRRHSHRRDKLEAALRELTIRQLKLQASIRRLS
jgi:hypothetical protein